MHDIAQKQIFFFKLPELDPDQDLVVKFPDPAKRSGFGSATLLFTLVLVKFRVREVSNISYFNVIDQQYKKWTKYCIFKGDENIGPM
jgi:hypothetical protein